MYSTKKYDIVVAGYTCIDISPDFKKDKLSIAEIFRPGMLTEIDGISLLPGGVVPNAGMALKKFNKKVYLNGLIGDDFFGKALIEWLSRYGLAEGIQSTKKEGTALSIVIAPPGVDRIFLESIGCSKIFDDSYINYQVTAQSRMFHFGYPPLLKQFYIDQGRQLAEMYAKVQKSGVVTSLDFSLPDPESESAQINWKEILKRTLPQVDICAPSLEEACQMIMPEEYARIQSTCGNLNIIDNIPVGTVRELGRTMISYGARIILIKAAHKGLFLFTDDISSVNKKLGNILDEQKWSNCQFLCNAFTSDPSKVKNACGSGDVAIAAFLAAILDGNDPVSSMKYAALAGRNNLYCNNPFEELDDWKTMNAEILEGSDMITDLGMMQVDYK